ncbi:hypothetical protein ABTX15_21890 [Micromonospora sp. NPDC094482]|uniref:hypothetical protein n=1 Tax=unclassified Micromonospora TaxID=2617518 RepID=UPI003320A20A
MTQGEAEHGCAQGEPCRPGHHEQQAGAKHRRLVGGVPPFTPEPVGGWPAESTGGWPAERAEEEVPVPRQRSGELPSPVEPEPVTTASGCRSVLPGWAGAHRHGPVRPRQRGARREHPPRRWC